MNSLQTNVKVPLIEQMRQACHSNSRTPGAQVVLLTQAGLVTHVKNDRTLRKVSVQVKPTKLGHNKTGLKQEAWLKG
jgi:hypothetical protein